MTCAFVKFVVYSPSLSETRNIAIPRELHTLVFGTDTSVEYLVKQNFLASGEESVKDVGRDTVAIGKLKDAIRYGARKMDVSIVNDEEEMKDDMDTVSSTKKLVVTLNPYRIVQKNQTKPDTYEAYDQRKGQIFNKAIKVNGLYAMYKVFCDDELIERMRGGKDASLGSHVLRFEVYTPEISNAASAYVSEKQLVSMLGSPDRFALLLPENKSLRSNVLELICRKTAIKDAEIFNHMKLVLPFESEETRDEIVGEIDNLVRNGFAKATKGSKVEAIDVSEMLKEKNKSVSTQLFIQGEQIDVSVVEDPDLLHPAKRRGLRISGLIANPSEESGSSLPRKLESTFSEAELVQKLDIDTQAPLDSFIAKFWNHLYVERRSFRLNSIKQRFFEGECFIGEERMYVYLLHLFKVLEDEGNKNIYIPDEERQRIGVRVIVAPQEEKSSSTKHDFTNEEIRDKLAIPPDTTIVSI
eukprot:g3667.t1